MNIAIILAGGVGKRVGADVPKQFIRVLDKPVLAYVLENFQDDDLVDGIEIVCGETWNDEVRRICRSYRIDKFRYLAPAGDTFQKSAVNGIYNLSDKISREDIVILSFGVSPFTTPDIIDDSIRVAKEHGNGISSEDYPLCSCVKDDEKSTTVSLIRETVKGFSNPWAFRYGELLDAYNKAEEMGILEDLEPHTTSVYLALGKRLWFSKSSGYNFKITVKEDLDKFEGLLLLKNEREARQIKADRDTAGCQEGTCVITYKEFEVLNTVLKAGGGGGISDIADYVYRNVRYRVFKSEDEADALVKMLEKKGFIADNAVTESGLKEIESLKVYNAVILAAGGDDISAKSVYSMPKGLFVKNGETLIERQIRQLKEAGIDDITVVIGYKQELYFFLADKWGVNLEINPDLKKNNIYSLYIAKRHLDSTYVLNCDNYFEENPFSRYEYNSFHATVYKKDAHNELIVSKNDSGRILNIHSCEPSGECIYGHAYLDPKLSRRLVSYMDEEIDDFRVSALFWEEFISRHADDLEMYAREYPSDFLFEFDSIKEIQNIDGLFLSSVSGRINDKICSVLGCGEDEIRDINVLQKGLSNILFTFAVRGKRYIFRYPGDSTRFFIYRKNECVANRIAAKVHTDDTLIYIDEQGAKISRFRENCIDLHGKYYTDVELMKRIARKIRVFHDAGYDMPDWQEYVYDPVAQTERLFKEASVVKGDLFRIFDKEWIMIRKLQKYADMDGVKHTMCHNDINIDNVLLTDTTLDIIDYEFAGYNDPGYDFGRVIAGLEYDVDEPKIDEILEAYFGRPATKREHLHWMAYSAIHN